MPIQSFRGFRRPASAAAVAAALAAGWAVAGAVPARAASVTLTPQADTFLAEFNPNAVYGSRWWLYQSGDRQLTARVLLRFDLSALPPGATVSSARLELFKWGGDRRGDRVAVHAVRRPWVETGAGGAGWNRAGGGTSWTTPGGDFDPAAVAQVRLSDGGGWKTWDVTPLVQQWVAGSRPNHGFLLKHPTEAGNRPWNLFASRESWIRPRLVITYASASRPDIVVVKAAQAAADPVNGTTNPKAIPGASIVYTLRTSNHGDGPADPNSLVLVDPVPARTALVVTDLSGAGSGPVVFRDGPRPSGVTYAFAGLASLTDDLDFSRDGGATWNYVPVPDAAGVDAAVTHLRVRPRGTLAAAIGPGFPGFELRFQVRVR